MHPDIQRHPPNSPAPSRLSKNQLRAAKTINPTSKNVQNEQGWNPLDSPAGHTLFLSGLAVPQKIRSIFQRTFRIYFHAGGAAARGHAAFQKSA
jgi:hypothetical protein